MREAVIRGAAFVVRDGGRWWWAPVPGATPEPAALEDVCRAVGAEPDPSALDPSKRGPGPDPLDADAVVVPAWAWVGRVVSGGIEVEDAGGRRLVLDEDDLRLLDAVDPHRRADGVVDRAGGPVDGLQRLGRLAAAGKLRVLAPGEAPPAPPAAPDEIPVGDDVDALPTLGALVHLGATGGETVDARVPVLAIWQERVGPALSTGMLTAAARSWQDGALGATYDIGRPVTGAQALHALAGRPGPAVLLCSNYVWSIDHNLEVARRAKALCPELVVVHGGPSTPKYDADAERFLADHDGVAHVLVQGEGEVAVCRILEALAPSVPALDATALAAIPGLTFRDPADGRVVRTGPPERIADLDALPSPYLTGEFDDLDPSAFHFAASVETTRGCPYGCTFCDWGSATLARLRKFDVDRVLSEVEWAARRGIAAVQFCDANFGITARDIEVARGLADIGRRHGAPRILAFTPPKNTTRHLTRILDEVLDAGFLVSTAISLQTTDEATLTAVDRSNIATEHYLALAADLRRRGLPLTGDLLIGLPGQTYESYRADLQFFLDHQISPRSWSLRSLPNAPMNEPGYRRRFAIRTGPDRVVISTSTMSEDDRARMLSLRKVQVVADQYGVLAHLLRFLQWDWGLAMATVLDRVRALVDDDPRRYPLVSWLFPPFDLHPTAPVGWQAFYDEVGRFLDAELGVDPTASDVDTVLTVQAALMPFPGRTFPAVVELAHDHTAYDRDATAGLYDHGQAGGPPPPRAAHPPGLLQVTCDPPYLCPGGRHFAGDPRDESLLGQFWLGVGSSHELASPLTRVPPQRRHLELAAREAGLESAGIAEGGDSVAVAVDAGSARP